MKHTRALLMAFSLLKLFALNSASAGPQSVEHLEMRVTYRYDFLLYLPDGYDRRSDARWPLLLFLHGLGERGTDIELVKRHGLPRMIEQGQKFPCIIVSPQCPDDEWWNILALEALLDRLVEKYHVDPDCVCVTGLSMGGYGTWALAQRHPERYAAVVPICGGGEIRHAAALRDLPLWAFHGARDPTVPVKRSQEMIDGITAAGGSPKLTIYPDGGHNVWDETYANPELWSWLFAQRRRPVSATPSLAR